jgi:hypothetical protein
MCHASIQTINLQFCRQACHQLGNAATPAKSITRRLNFEKLRVVNLFQKIKIEIVFSNFKFNFHLGVLFGTNIVQVNSVKVCLHPCMIILVFCWHLNGFTFNYIKIVLHYLCFIEQIVLTFGAVTSVIVVYSCDLTWFRNQALN